MTAHRPISPTGRAALARLAENRLAGRHTHVSAIHQSAREALVARGLAEVRDRYLVLTEAGLAAAA